MHTTHRVGLDPRPSVIPLRIVPIVAQPAREMDLLEELLESVRLSKHYDPTVLLSELISLSSDPLRRQITLLYYKDQMSVADVVKELALEERAVQSHLRRFRISACEALMKLLAASTAIDSH